METATRYHDISCGHRVAGHESKCAHLHGHNYRVFFTLEADKLDEVGRVLDFSAIKSKLCYWLEDTWDHKFLAWEGDMEMQDIYAASDNSILTESIVWVPFNPTAEHMANYLLTVVGPQQLAGTGTRLLTVTVEETRKCSATAQL